MKKLVICLIIIFVTGCSQYNDDFVLDGYYDSNEYWDTDGFQDHTDYCEYFYDANDDDKFINSNDYSKIDSNNIDNIKNYFKDHEQWVRKGYDFNIDVITIGDYYHLETKEGQNITENHSYGKYDNYSVYLYDIEEHILYFIHTSK